MWPLVDATSRALAVETVIRLTVSHIVQPTMSPDESAERIASIASIASIVARVDEG